VEAPIDCILHDDLSTVPRSGWVEEEETKMTSKGSYPLDSDNQGWIVGWGVIRNEPWDLAGMFPTKQEAEVAREKLGESYRVRYGSRKLGSNDFIDA
jgi:hypothetical protein